MNNDWREYQDELYHHGIKGQKWGVRRFQTANGDLTAAGRSRYYGDSGSSYKASNGIKVGAPNSKGIESFRKFQETKIERPSKIQLKKEAKRVGKIYDEELTKGYKKSGELLEKYTGDKYFDLVDSIESTAAKNTLKRYTKEYGQVHIDELGKSKNSNARKVSYWNKQN